MTFRWTLAKALRDSEELKEDDRSQHTGEHQITHCTKPAPLCNTLQSHSHPVLLFACLSKASSAHLLMKILREAVH